MHNFLDFYSGSECISIKSQETVAILFPENLFDPIVYSYQEWVRFIILFPSECLFMR